MSKSLLMICRHAPWSGPTAREALDMALAAGAFDLPVSMLFLDDGVFQLMPGQQAAALQQKDITASLGALELFGIEQLYVSSSDLARRGLSDTALLLEVSALADHELADLFNQHDLTVTL